MDWRRGRVQVGGCAARGGVPWARSTDRSHSIRITHEQVRDKDTGNFKGFGFIKYENQKSTILAVDNFNGTELLGRTIRVDHVERTNGT